jgi:hypothetical protein
MLAKNLRAAALVWFAWTMIGADDCSMNQDHSVCTTAPAGCPL